MKSRFQLAWLVVGVALIISRLAAQDVTVTDPAWFDPENPPADQLPQFKKRPSPNFPDELKNSEQVAYVIMGQVIDEKGDDLSCELLSTNPHADKVIEFVPKYSPATREGRAVTAHCWFGVIFNPRSASPKKDDAVPRLLAVAPITVKEKDLPQDGILPKVIWATLSIDEKGQLLKFVFDEPMSEVFREPVNGSIRRWKFAPARRGGFAVTAELHVSLIPYQPHKPKIPRTLPTVVHQEQPVYPTAMQATSMRGEVLVEFIVDTVGAVKAPVIVQTNNPGFNDAAIDAVLKWTFVPGREGGEPVEARMQQPFVFDFTNRDGRDFATVGETSKKNQAKLPPEFQHDIAPQAKGVLMPVYPYFLFRDEVFGRASVIMLIDAGGRVIEVKVIEATKPEFGLALAASAEAFSFVPAMKGGKPTQAVLKIKQEFTSSDFGTVVTDKDEELIKLEKKHPEKIFLPKKLDSPLKVISQCTPVFPSLVQSQFMQGEAKIEVLIDQDGKVRLPRIVTATDPAFGYAAVQAVVAWRFEPPMVGGKPVVVRARVPFEFKLETADVKPGETEP